MPEFVERHRNTELTVENISDGSYDIYISSETSKGEDRLNEVRFVAVPNRRSPRFFHSDLKVEIVIGIDPSDIHSRQEVDKKGNVSTYQCTYGDLLVWLNFFGWDVLAGIRYGRQYKRNLQKVFDVFKKHETLEKSSGRATRNKMLSDFRRCAEDIRDNAKAYVRGEVSGIPKATLDSDTLYTRDYKSTFNPAWYSEGINEALVETGELEDAISILSINLTGDFGKVRTEFDPRRRIHRTSDQIKEAARIRESGGAKKIKEERDRGYRKFQFRMVGFNAEFIDPMSISSIEERKIIAKRNIDTFNKFKEYFYKQYYDDTFSMEDRQKYFSSTLNRWKTGEFNDSYAVANLSMKILRGLL
jgi:hypothetical protein